MVDKLLGVGMMAGLLVAGDAAAQTHLQPAHGGHPGQWVTCESRDGRYRHCAMDTRGGVQMARQLSRAQCFEGRNWGVDRHGVWVDQGCRAQFASGGGGYRGGAVAWPGDQGGHLRCESINGRYRQCPVDTRRGVQLVRQVSSAPCIEGRSWGSNRAGVWVNNGCRAEFVVGQGPRRGPVQRVGQYRGGSGYGDVARQPQHLHCASDGGRQRRCATFVRGGVTLQRQVSRAACIEGRTWGWTTHGIWVNSGCRADFLVY
ncbi:MAG: DUF3011 domain-containing protein [Pseudoxanthomonas suwonensis]|nr:DUF3011 domain-containing protein [Pseudoxanthomonas suwonensis]